MKTYRGVVRGGVVELTEPADLAEGVEVEVRVDTVRWPDREEALQETAFEEALVSDGVLLRRAVDSPRPAQAGWEPIHMDGQPISQAIIEERGRPL